MLGSGQDSGYSCLIVSLSSAKLVKVFRILVELSKHRLNIMVDLWNFEVNMLGLSGDGSQQWRQENSRPHFADVRWY